MPHVCIKLSENIKPSIQVKTLSEKVHFIFKAFSAFKQEAVITHVDWLKNCLIGNCEKEQGYLGVRIGILSGRALAVRQALSEAAYTELTRYLEQVNIPFPCLYDVELYEINPDTYLHG